MASPSLYERILGQSFDDLSTVLKGIHDTRQRKRYLGRCDIRGGRSWVARLITRFAGLPQAKLDVPLAVTIVSQDHKEEWIRQFGSNQMRSALRDRNGQLEERLGPLVLTFKLTAEREEILWVLKAARLAIVPLPITPLLNCAARESLDDGRYAFDVSASVIGIGLIVHYKGWLLEDA